MLFDLYFQNYRCIQQVDVLLLQTKNIRNKFIIW